MVIEGLGIGGAEVVVRNLARGIDRRRFNVTLCCIKVRGQIGDELAEEGMDVVTLSDARERWTRYFSFVRLLALVRRKRIDVLHSHSTDALADGAVCKLLRPKLKLVHTFHFGNYPHRRRREARLERTFSRVADRLCAVGEEQRQRIMSFFHLREDRILKVWNGISCMPTTCDNAFRRRTDSENRLLIGTIATLIEQKGLRELLAVAAQFRDLREKIRFVVVGDGALRTELEAMRHAMGLDDMVVFSGWVANAARTALPTFDVFFLPSLWEAMSIAILEAMASGRPIVATRVGENPYMIDNEVDGLLVEPKDVEGMAKAIRLLVNDAELRDRLGAAARRKIAQKFTVEQMTRNYEQIYSSML